MNGLLKIYAWTFFLCVLWLGTPGTNNDAWGSPDRLFPALEGWNQPEEIDVYVPDNLWDIINGAADLFMAYDFRELYWGRYTNSGDNNLYIVMEIYRQGSPVKAYGVYSQERPRPPRLIDVGVQGFTAPGAFHFFAADCYIRMRSHDTSAQTAEAMEKLARKVSGILDASPSFPPVTHLLPEEGKVAYSDEFINTNFLGHPFLSGAFVSAYEINANRFNLFALECDDRSACEKMLEDYHAFSRQDTGAIREGIIRIADRWNGEVGIVWKDNFLYGYYNLEDEELKAAYLNYFSGL